MEEKDYLPEQVFNQRKLPYSGKVGGSHKGYFITKEEKQASGFKGRKR